MSWAHTNLLGEYDFSDKKLKDTAGRGTGHFGAVRYAKRIRLPYEVFVKNVFTIENYIIPADKTNKWDHL